MKKLLGIALAAGLLAMLPLAAVARQAYPERIDLPDGFRPEGIAIGKGARFYAGSLGTGAIYAGDLRTGEGGILVPPQPGRVSVGLAVDNNEHLYVAGGPTGHAYVYDGRTGVEIADLTLSGGPSFINDVVVTRTDAWFTNSFQPVLYRVPIGPDGALGTPETVNLGGDYQQVGGFNVNGIDATPDGSALVIVQSATGRLFHVDPDSGDATVIDLGGDTVPAGDGIVLDGKRLYVVRNAVNLVVRVDLAPDFLSGAIAGTVTSPDFSVPTTAAEFGNALYVVNARFNVNPTPATEYWITRIVKF